MWRHLFHWGRQTKQGGNLDPVISTQQIGQGIAVKNREKRRQGFTERTPKATWSRDHAGPAGETLD
ncbi:hypothetical protein ASG60_08240 [Methylobacterium sp. Leaf469]|jgi:hypothetical protein|nr:hypothetical protein ASG60_08240 [Methylobacterium sp. Leaf469]